MYRRVSVIRFLFKNISEDNVALAFSKGFSFTFFVAAVILFIGFISSMLYFRDKDNKVYETELE
ncbi:hypothetical protein ACFO6R_07085 [Eubacterium multiforme]|uniref:Uncharacterized protein n=1 Tax=Eubacterium multiforme TaxID=83339 RepID=A0ABT9UWG5_9FIRM|nr:hypothetical protein [Eubacterium multiforme]MDQ0150642.1 hypothetical protein [Eubacterium multiforme]